MKNVSIRTNNRNQQPNILKKPSFWAMAAMAFFVLSGIPDDDRARETLEENNYTSIETKGLAFAFNFSCSTLLKTRFQAVKDEQRIHGVVCQTLFKNRTNIYIKNSEPL